MRNKKIIVSILALTLATSLCACATPETDTPPVDTLSSSTQTETAIVLSDEGITVNGAPAADGGPVLVGATTLTDQVSDDNGIQSSDSYRTVTITRPGLYDISGTMRGQLAVDLGEDAKNDPAAVVTLTLNGVDIVCGPAPAIHIRSAYECADVSTASAARYEYTADTSSAGANVVLAGGRNIVEGASSALCSDVTLNIAAEDDESSLSLLSTGDGLLCSRHLTINGGVINTCCDEDGIAAMGEDSIVTVNDGLIYAGGSVVGEGDGLYSEGYINVNGGELYASAGVDGGLGIYAACGLYLNDGSVIAIGDGNSEPMPRSEALYLRMDFIDKLPFCSNLCITAGDNTLINYITDQPAKNVLYASGLLESGVGYRVSVDGVPQRYVRDSLSYADFELSDAGMSFENVASDAGAARQKTVAFSADIDTSGGAAVIRGIVCSEDVDPAHVRVMVASEPNREYTASCTLAEGTDAVNALLRQETGIYRLTLEVVDDEEYTGIGQFVFQVLVLPED